MYQLCDLKKPHQLDATFLVCGTLSVKKTVDSLFICHYIDDLIISINTSLIKSFVSIQLSFL